MTARFGSTADVAKLLRVSDDTVRRLIQRGDITAVRSGRLWRVRLDLLGARR